MAIYNRKEARRGIRFTMLVAGASGTGKTSFINSLLDENIMNHKFESNKNNKKKLITFSNLNSSLNAIELEEKFDANNSNLEPGIAITESNFEIIDDDNSKILLTIIDTPGFGDNLNNSICIKEICNFLEQQFDYVLAEETKVKRNPRFEDTRVHVCIYFIEPTGHGLKELDIESMIKMSKYVNIIPIISKADSFTELELKNFKRNINEDIERFKIPIFQFQFDENDEDLIQEYQYLSSLQPFSIITSDNIEIIEGKSTRIRNYPWGKIDINNTKYSDFPILKNVLLGSQLQDLKDITHDFLYEAYRTEKLSSVIDYKDSSSVSLSNNYSNEPPSMSNLAEIANSKSMQKFNKINNLTNELSKTTINEEITDNDGDDGDEREHENGNDNEEISSNISQSTLNKNIKSFKPPMIDSNGDSPQLSVKSNSSFIQNNLNHTSVDTKKIRKISETVPYIIRKETLLSKQAKLEELEKQNSIDLSKRAAELERKANELKFREAKLKERLASMNQSAHSVDTSNSNYVDSTE